MIGMPGLAIFSGSAAAAATIPPRTTDPMLAEAAHGARPQTTPSVAIGPIVPPNNPPVIDSDTGLCVLHDSTALDCLTAINAARADQEGLATITLPSNWASLTSAEQMFVFANLERTSRNEAPITELVKTYDVDVQNAVESDEDPYISSTYVWGSIWAGGYGLGVLGAFDLWLYVDGPGGNNEDCSTTTSPGCWGHRDIILANGATATGFAWSLANPTEMDAASGSDFTNATSLAAVFIPNPTPPAPDSPSVVLTWTEEKPYLILRPTITSFTPTVGPAAGGTTVTITGTNFTGATSVKFGTTAAASFTVTRRPPSKPRPKLTQGPQSRSRWPMWRGRPPLRRRSDSSLPRISPSTHRPLRPRSASPTPTRL